MTHDNNIGATTVTVGKALDFSEENTPASNQEKELEYLMKVTDAIAQHTAQRPTPANEWRSDFLNFYFERGKHTGRKLGPQEYMEYIQNLLDQHSAHLVERGKHEGVEIARKYLRSSQEECMCYEKNMSQFDRLRRGEFPELQAIDIIKDNK